MTTGAPPTLVYAKRAVEKVPGTFSTATLVYGKKSGKRVKNFEYLQKNGSNIIHNAWKTGHSMIKLG